MVIVVEIGPEGEWISRIDKARAGRHTSYVEHFPKFSCRRPAVRKGLGKKFCFVL
jgi:hypothetical protein